MKITYYGHSSLGIEINGIHLLTDPFIASNPKAAHIDMSSIPVDYVLLSHAHYDHVMDLFFLQKEKMFTSQAIQR